MMIRSLFSLSLAAALIVSEANAQVPPDLELVTVQSGFTGATAMRFPDDASGRIFVTERTGRVRIVGDNGIESVPFLRLCNSAASGCFVPAGGFTSGNSEQGLLGIDFHPLFPSDSRVFLNYTNSSGSTVIASVPVQAGNPNLADTSQFQQILVINQDFANHNGGDLHFGPDGYLYIATGDGGSGNDPCSRAQTMKAADLQTGGSCGSSASRALLGKMLRLDIDASTPAGSNTLCGAAGNGSAAYAIPNDNPYASGTTGNCAEIWAAGLRNPWRFSIDSQTGDIWIGDVGQNQREEVNLEPAGSGGRNYGWRCREGTRVNFTSAPYCNDAALVATFVPPTLEYNTGPSNTCAVTGGVRYRGPAPSLQGIYFFADYCQGALLLGQESSPGVWSISTAMTPGGLIPAFSEDPQGHAYVMTNATYGGGNSIIYRITGAIPDQIFVNDFEGN